MASQPCLRNMSCTCPLCAGEDISDLLSTLKTSSSNIYANEDPENEQNIQLDPTIMQKKKTTKAKSPLKLVNNFSF